MIPLLLANLLALPILSFPAFGFIHYMDLHGIRKFLFVGWTAVVAASFLVWPRIARRSGVRSYGLSLLSAYLPAVLGYAAGLYKLYSEISPYYLWKYSETALLIGGLFTAGYWLPASVVNFMVLRQRAA